MRRKTPSLSPVLDAIEPRVLPSVAAPLISTHALRADVREVRTVMASLAQTGNLGRAENRLVAIAATIPGGAEVLVPEWRTDLSVYHDGRATTAAVAENRIIGDLESLVEAGGAATSPPGSWISPPANSGASATPVSPSEDSVTIQNETGLALAVTVRLDVPQVQQPYFTETIPAQSGSAALFNFGTATDAFMTITITNADGVPSPPYLTVGLDQPIGGYNDAAFTISMVGPYFNISPG